MDFFLFGIIEAANMKKYIPPEIDFQADAYLTVFTYDVYIKDLVPNHQPAVLTGENTLNNIIEKYPNTQRIVLYAIYDSDIVKYFIDKRQYFMNFSIRCDLIEKPVQRRISYEMQYLQTLANILRSGDIISGRNGDVISNFDIKLKIDLAEGFPILTLREINFRAVVEEALWILRGETSSKTLEDKKINIWKKNTTREFLDSRGLNEYESGEMGPSYGFQLRHAGANYDEYRQNPIGTALGVDQWTNLIKILKEEPSSRRAIINLWSASEINKMALPPCAFCYQFQVRNGKLHCILTQRSWDIILGWNPTTAAIFTHLLAKYINVEVGTLTVNVADCHIYTNFAEMVRNNLCIRAPYCAPKIKIRDNISEDPMQLSVDDFELIDYHSHPKIFFPQQ